MIINKETEVIIGTKNELTDYFFEKTKGPAELNYFPHRNDRNAIKSRLGIRKQLTKIEKQGGIGMLFYLNNLNTDWKPIECTSKQVPTVEFILRSAYVHVHNTGQEK